MTVQGPTGGRGTSAVRSAYPVSEGTTFGTTKTHNIKRFLRPTKKSLLSYKDKVGL